MEKKKTDEEILTEVIDGIVKRPWEKPMLHFKYPATPQEMTPRMFLDWTEMVGLYYDIAKRYEEQERGWAFSTDRAYRQYLEPETNKMFSFLASLNTKG